MAAKKSPKKTQSGSTSKSARKTQAQSPFSFLQELVDSIPEDVKQELLSSLMGGLGDEPPPARGGSRHTRRVEQLLQEVEFQDSASDALPLLREASDLARKALGKRFEKYSGRLGEIDAGELYLDVQCELVLAYRATGKTDLAIATAEEALQLDPCDPEGICFALLGAYFDSDRLDDVERILAEHSDESWAGWSYSQLLLALRRGQRGEEVDRFLIDAHRENASIVANLLAYDLAEAFEQDPFASDDAQEAQRYLMDFLTSWRETPGALSWLREATSRLRLELPKDELSKPQRLTARDYAKMPPHEHPTWIVGVHETPNILMAGASERRTMWLVYSFSPTRDLVGFDVRERHPKARELWDVVTEFMQQADNEGRPERILVHPPELLQKLKKDAAKAGIELDPCTDLGEIPTMLEQLAARLQGGSAAAQQLPPGAVQEAPLNVDEVFEAAVVQLEQRLHLPDEILRPWVALVMSRTSGLILWNELFMDTPPASALENAVRMAIARPAMVAPCRPREVIVRDHDEAQALKALSDEAGFNCTASGDLPLIQQALKRLTDEFLGHEKGAVLSRAEGILKSDLETFYTAAADFYRARPWRHFAMNELVALDWRDAHGKSARWFGFVMGQSGITQGLAAYQSRVDVEAMFAESKSGEDMDSMSVMFGEEGSIAPPDLDAIEQFGWPIATPEAYPEALRVFPGMRVQTPSADEFRFLTAALDAITRLSQNRDEDQVTSSAGNVSVQAHRQGFV